MSYNKIAFLLALTLPALHATAQTIRGRVVDKATREPLTGAIVEAVGTGQAAVTDTAGCFRIARLEKGKTYSISVSYLSYRRQTIADVPSVADGKGQPLTIGMAADDKQLGEVVVTGVVRGSTETAMVEKAKASSVVESNVSSQEIKRSQDSNAGEVIRRVPGVSLIDDKFVMVRGLSQRYNNVWINGGAVPSSEADTRAFSFDMIPSWQIDNLTIVKTLAAEYPADYTGGFILISTKEIPIENELHVTLGGAWNSRSAFRQSLATRASSTDWLGFDSGLRSLHGGMDATLGSLGRNSGGNTMYSLEGNHLDNDWRVRRHHPWGDLKLGLDWSRRWNLDGRKLGLTAAATYTNEHRAILHMLNNLYDAYDVGNDRANPLRLSTDDQYNHNVRLGAMANLTLLSRGGNSKLQLKNIFNQMADSRYTRREGTSAQSEPERSAEYYYRSRTTYTGQLTGRHTFSADTFDWSAGYAYANRRLPDRRRYILYDEDGGSSPTSSGEGRQDASYVWLYQNDISREWTSLDEHIVSLQANDEHAFAWGSWAPKVKVGAYGEYRTRQYKTRNFLYWYDTAGNTLPSGFRAMDMTVLLSDAANFGADKLYLLEDVNKTNDYDGHNLLGAGYVSVALPFGRLSVLAGVRFEWNQMELVTNRRQNEVSHMSHYYRHADFFPSFNMTYRLTDAHQLRLAYGRSVNRPEFREVSPSVYYDFDLASDVQGNYDLRNCYASNVDLRYEWYPSKGEVVSLAAFYKHFSSPIEWVYTMSGGTDVVYSYKNARSADNYGLELDLRKNLAFIGLPCLSWSLNGALIHSRVHFDPGSVEYNRPMQGQSPYLVNTGLFYRSEPLQLDVSLLYNRIGKRIVGVGRTEGGDADKNVRVPDSYEMPRDALDLSAAKRLGRHWEVRLAVRDLLNENIQQKQFAHVVWPDGRQKEIHQVTRRYKPGRTWQLSLTWKL